MRENLVSDLTLGNDKMNSLSHVIYSISFEKFPVVGGGWMLDYSISSGPFSVRIETNSLRVDNDNVQDQDPSLTNMLKLIKVGTVV